MKVRKVKRKKGERRPVVRLYFLPGDYIYEVFDDGILKSRVEAVVIRAPWRSEVEVYYQTGPAWDDCTKQHSYMFQTRFEARVALRVLRQGGKL